MMETRLNKLYIEDDARDADLTCRELKHMALQFAWDVATTRDAYPRLV